MLVVFIPKEGGEEYIDERIQPTVNKWSKEPAKLFQATNRVVAFWPSHPVAEVIVKPNGWFVGHAYWDELPSGYTEVSKDLLDMCLQLWRLEGVDFLKRLSGSFNLFLHDAASGKSLVSTDRFATYPLWRAELEGGGLAFSPCYYCLTPLIKSHIDIAALWSSIARTRAIGNRTLLERIRGVRQSTAICFEDSSGSSTIEWYTPKFEPESSRSISFWAAEFNNLLGEAIKMQLSGFESPGLLLSGGMDSRLIASFCPPQTKCFTLADFQNREMKTAAKIARICGLEHFPVIRESDWYPDMLEAAVKQCLGLWRWSNAHFMPLATYGGEWQEIDCVLMGYAFDTFFKGYEPPAELLSNPIDLEDIEQAISFLLDVDESQCKFVSQLEEVMRVGAFEECQRTYQDVLRAELKRVIPISSCIIDAWEMLQFRSIYRVPSYAGMFTLRRFIPVRNMVFHNRFYDLYFRIPAYVRVTGDVVRRALWQRRKAMGILTDSNSWLPVVLPNSFHSAAIKTRGKVGVILNKWHRLIGSKEYRSQSAWPRVGRLWAHHPKMRAVMDSLVQDPPGLLEQFFCMDSIRRVWEKHKEGTSDYYEVISFVAGLGLLEIE